MVTYYHCSFFLIKEMLLVSKLKTFQKVMWRQIRRGVKGGADIHLDSGGQYISHNAPIVYGFSRYCISWIWHSFIFYYISEVIHTWARISQGGATYKLMQSVYFFYLHGEKNMRKSQKCTSLPVSTRKH